MRTGRGIALAAALLGTAAVAQAEDGAALYETHCAACHNTGGTGTPGLAPPLDRPDFWSALGEHAPSFISGVITKGFNMKITVRGEQYMGTMMPPVMGATDAELASIATWVVGTLGQTGQTVSAEEIAAARGAMTNDALKALRPASE